MHVRDADRHSPHLQFFLNLAVLAGDDLQLLLVLGRLQFSLHPERVLRLQRPVNTWDFFFFDTIITSLTLREPPGRYCPTFLNSPAPSCPAPSASVRRAGRRRNAWLFCCTAGEPA